MMSFPTHGVVSNAVVPPVLRRRIGARAGPANFPGAKVDNLTKLEQRETPPPPQQEFRLWEPPYS